MNKLMLWTLIIGSGLAIGVGTYKIIELRSAEEPVLSTKIDILDVIRSKAEGKDFVAKCTVKKGATATVGLEWTKEYGWLPPEGITYKRFVRINRHNIVYLVYEFKPDKDLDVEFQMIKLYDLTRRTATVQIRLK